MKGTCILLMICFLTASCQFAAGEPEDDLMTIVVQGYRQAMASLRSGKGRTVVSISLDKPAGGRLSAETTYDYAFSGDRFAYRSTTTYLANDLPEGDQSRLVPSGTVLKRNASFDGEKTYLLEVDEHDGFVGSSTTIHGRVVLGSYQRFAAWANHLATLDKYITAGIVQPRVAGRELLNGDECILVEFAWTDRSASGGDIGNSVLFWVDTQKGFVVPRIRSWSSGGVYKEKTLTAEITVEFRDLGNSLWAPKRFTHDEYRLSKESGENKLVSRDIVTYDPGFQWNVSVSDAEIAPIPFPTGTRVRDEILDADYIQP